MYGCHKDLRCDNDDLCECHGLSRWADESNITIL